MSNLNKLSFVFIPLDLLPPPSNIVYFRWESSHYRRVLGIENNTHTTRMHSSRMRTARSSSRLLGGVCLSACWDTPPGSGPGDLPLPGPGHPQAWAWTPPPGHGPGHLPGCKACWDPHPTRPPPPAARHAGIYTPHRQIDTSKNITFANYVCGW